MPPTPTITYNPTGPAWSITIQPIKVSPGSTTITWGIALSQGAGGAVQFSTDAAAPGIVFAPGWPGPAPTGNAQNWSVDVDDTLQSGDQPQTYPYSVNALYMSPGSSTWQKVKWDPDVEMDPPSVMV